MNDFEENMKQIEAIISKIDKGEVNLAQLATEVEKAVQVGNDMYTTLAEAIEAVK